MATWTQLWNRWPAREVFAHPAYLRMFRGDAERVLCAAWQSEGATVLYPFILRDLTGEPYCPEGLAPAHDTVTPYGYGGPFWWGSGPAPNAAFWTSFDAWAGSQGVVAEFLRLSLDESHLLAYPGQREEKQQNVVRELDLDDDALWMDVEHKVRKNVKTARRCGVVIEQDSDGTLLDDFLSIYATTMDRRAADRGYYFPRSFFEQLCQDLAGQFVFFHAFVDGQMVSTELVLVSAHSVYSFLGGTLRSAFAARPNDLLKFEVIRWAKDRHKKNFVLGGGYEPNDGIFRYKRSFAPSGRVPFHVGHRILRPDIYQRLIDERARLATVGGQAWAPRAGFFPAYRRPAARRAA